MTGEAARGLSPAIWRPIADTFAVLITVTAIAFALSVPRMLAIDYYPQQFYAGILTLILPAAFLMLPARRKTERTVVPWLDVLLAVIGFAAMAYLTLSYPRLVLQIFARPPDLWIPGLVVILLTLEALRRATGWTLVIIIAAFLLYALFGDVFPGRLQGRAQNWQMLASYMAVDSNGLLTIPLAVTAKIIIAFLFFGALLNNTGGSQFFTDAAMLWMGRFRGGSMKIAVLASGLFGSISGSAVANVVSTGVVTIPMIKRDGYPAHKAGAIEAVASTGGQLMPPVMGASAFLMAEFLAVPYSQVVLAALVPAVLYYIALFIQADLEAARLGIRAIPPDDIPDSGTVLRGMHFFFAFAVLIYLLFVERYQPERAAIWAALALAVTSTLIGYRGRRASIGKLLRSFVDAGHIVVELGLIAAASGLVIGVLNITGLSFNLTYLLVQIGGGDVILLLALSAGICIVLGMGLPTLGVYVLLAALVAPALVRVGIEPIAAHLYVLYFGMMSMITPPIAIAAFAAATIAKAPPMATGWAAVRFGWSAYVIPVLFVFSPSLILIGTPGAIVLAVTTAVMGIWLVSCALAGYFVRRLPGVSRILFAAAGLMALVPAGAFDGAAITDIFGVALGAVLMVTEVLRTRRLSDTGSGV